MIFFMKQPVGFKTPGKFILLRIFDFQAQHFTAQKTFKRRRGNIINFDIRFRINSDRIVRNNQIRFFTDMEKPKRQV